MPSFGKDQRSTLRYQYEISLLKHLRAYLLPMLFVKQLRTYVHQKSFESHKIAASLGNVLHFSQVEAAVQHIEWQTYLESLILSTRKCLDSD
jgi:hypothetical protein